MTPEDRKVLQNQQEARLLKYQHQHRGLRFLKLFLPPVTNIKINLVGLDNHIYKGSIPRIPEDQLPPGVEKSLDEEALYKEIRDMSFPPVPEQQPLGPSRRIGGEYTLTKRIALEPVEVNYREGYQETLILGKDGNVYKGTEQYPSKTKLDKKLSGTKRVFNKVRYPSSSRGFIEPTLVSLPTDESEKYYVTKSLIAMPINEIEKVKSLLTSQNIGKKEVRIKEPTEDKEDRQETESADESESLPQNESVDEISTNKSDDTTQLTDSEQSHGRTEESDKDVSQETESADESVDEISTNKSDDTTQGTDSEQSQGRTEESDKVSQETESADESESLPQNEEIDDTNSIQTSDSAQKTEIEESTEITEESGAED